jgi:hypothetical protein
MMTKKYYIDIAFIINNVFTVNAMDGKIELVEKLSDYFKSDNPRFNKGKFLKECGL